VWSVKVKWSKSGCVFVARLGRIVDELDAFEAGLLTLDERIVLGVTRFVESSVVTLLLT
jgi:hypothetical protein